MISNKYGNTLKSIGKLVLWNYFWPLTVEEIKRYANHLETCSPEDNSHFRFYRQLILNIENLSNFTLSACKYAGVTEILLV